MNPAQLVFKNLAGKILAGLDKSAKSAKNLCYMALVLSTVLNMNVLLESIRQECIYRKYLVTLFHGLC